MHEMAVTSETEAPFLPCGHTRDNAFLMRDFQHTTSPHSLTLSRSDLRSMIALVRSLQHLSELPAYQESIVSELMPTARFEPGNHSVMMAYDFHLSEAGPQLIEVNTNAGGLWPAYLTRYPNAAAFPKKMEDKLLRTFIDDFALRKGDSDAKPRSIAIVDEQPLGQFLYPEMRIFSDLFEKAGISPIIADPCELTAESSGLLLKGKPVDMIYNRHCDFYLESPTMRHIRSAWLAHQVCLSPNPRTYGLLGDKRRMIYWSDPAQMSELFLQNSDLDLILSSVPMTRLLKSFDPQELWGSRKKWIFKPATSYASRGVYSGKKLTRKKFEELDPDTTLVQRWIPPSQTRTEQGTIFKTDFRLFTYRDQILCVTARLYRGQVTNLQTEGGGFASVNII